MNRSEEKQQEFKHTVKIDAEMLRKTLEEQNPLSLPNSHPYTETLKLNISQDYRFLVDFMKLIERDATLALLGKFKLPYQKCNCVTCQNRVEGG